MVTERQDNTLCYSDRMATGTGTGRIKMINQEREPWLDNAKVLIPPEVLDLIRFLCATWSEVDQWAYENVDGDALGKYPVIQGTGNQINLQRIGAQTHDTENVNKAVKWMLECEI